MINLHKPTILIVEDEAVIRECLIDICSSITPNLLAAPNGKEALELFHKHKIDAVLSDNAMPLMDGKTFLRKIREEGSPVPFVLLTGFMSDGEIMRVMADRAFRILSKPYRDKDVIEALQLALKSSESGGTAFSHSKNH